MDAILAPERDMKGSWKVKVGEQADGRVSERVSERERYIIVRRS